MAEKLWNQTTKNTEKNKWMTPSGQMMRGFGGIKKTKRTPSPAMTQKYIKLCWKWHGYYGKQETKE